MNNPYENRDQCRFEDSTEDLKIVYDVAASYYSLEPYSYASM